MTPGTFDFNIVRGTTAPLIVALSDNVADVLTPVAYTSIVLSISKKATVGDEASLILRKISTAADGLAAVVDGDALRVTWTPSPAESRSLLVGAKNYYELEVRNGSIQVVYLLGTITGIGGINSDV